MIFIIEKNIFSVSQINGYIKSVLDRDKFLYNIYIKGEISNFKEHYSGHMYLSLKDENSKILAVMFKSSALKLKFKPENGMKVIAFGRISVFERDGQYQLYIDEMQPDGVGALHIAYEQLKEKLKNEGLFDEKFKKMLPQYPQTVGVVTSKTGAVIRDILNVLKRRYPFLKIKIFPTSVQGSEAPPQIVSAISYINKYKLCDVVIIARGGGSIEDLWAFNDENVARAVFESKIPIVSAVGHETDFTICDFVADFRAPTPSAAAEIIVPSKLELAKRIADINKRLYYCISKIIEINKNYYINLKSQRVLQNPMDIINEKSQYLSNLQTALIKNTQLKIALKKEQFAKHISKLEALSPLAVLNRGYAIATDEKNIVIKSAKSIKTNDNLNIKFKDGNVKCKVNLVEI